MLVSELNCAMIDCRPLLLVIVPSILTHLKARMSLPAIERLV
jgi:hypothetical protein